MREDKHIEAEKLMQINRIVDEMWENNEHRLKILHEIKEIEEGNRVRRLRIKDNKHKIRKLKKELKKEFVQGARIDAAYDAEYNEMWGIEEEVWNIP